MNDFRHMACDNLKARLTAAQFKLWDMHLYLDTHLCDSDMLLLYKKTQQQVMQLREAYEAQYGPLTPGSGAGAEWIQNPWPWDLKGDDCCV